MGKRFIILFAFLAAGFISKAQVDKQFEEIKKAQMKEFEQYVQKTQEEFTKYSDSINKEFSDYLRKNWVEFQENLTYPTLKTSTRKFSALLSPRITKHILL